MDLNECVPKTKHDHAAVQRACTVGFPALNPVLPKLLIWLQDTNWPVESSVAKLLSASGPEIVPHIRAVFVSDDSIWKHSILADLCPNLSPAILAELRSDIESLAKNPTAADRLEEVPDAAANLLATTRN
ncbi:DUF5071 domain-containing protein [Mesorhizobium yinganensis]|uniref:DUF5071 domain-containing protein n=1 Tax=Mesorhizobium yinganensis TaxID=3157707 RepID=UPI0032B77F84